jgi:hypothetical protein
MQNEDQNWNAKCGLLETVSSRFENSENQKGGEGTHIDSQIQQIERAWIWLVFTCDLELSSREHGHEQVQ